MARERDRLADLEAGADVLVYPFEVPLDMRPDRRTTVYRLSGSRLGPAEPR